MVAKIVGEAEVIIERVDIAELEVRKFQAKIKRKKQWAAIQRREAPKAAIKSQKQSIHIEEKTCQKQLG